MKPALSCQPISQNNDSNMPFVTSLLDKLAKVSTFDNDAREKSIDNFKHLGTKTRKKYLSSAFALSAINKSKLAKRDIMQLSLSGAMSMVLSKDDRKEMELMQDKNNLGVPVDDLRKKQTGQSFEIVDKYKYLTDKIEERFDKTLHQFWNTYNCMDDFEAVQEINTNIVKIHTHHCKNNFCIQCAGVKAYKSYTKYSKLLENNDYYMGTLTHKNCDYDQLRITIDAMRKKLKSIRKSYMKYCKANHLQHPSGIIKVEITFNKDNNTYHPHFHILTDSEAYLQYTVNAWTKYFKQDALHYLQDIRKANKKSILEIFKYFVKIVWNDQETNEIKFIPPKELFKITFATRGLHFYQSFGDFYGCQVDQDDDDDQVVECRKLFKGHYNYVLKTFIDDDKNEIINSEVDDQTEQIVQMLHPKFAKNDDEILKNISQFEYDVWKKTG